MGVQSPSTLATHATAGNYKGLSEYVNHIKYFYSIT